MATLDDVFGTGPVAKPPVHEIGQKLDSLSVDDLLAHLQILHEEVARLEADLVKKRDSRHAAERFFGSPQEKSG
ncbi:MAG: DUF1192 family protein [Hyphomicrobiales bacterium]|nr:DUF1192 family protein [Hyphomicrobiales bacterium]